MYSSHNRLSDVHCKYPPPAESITLSKNAFLAAIRVILRKSIATIFTNHKVLLRVVVVDLLAQNRYNTNPHKLPRM